MTCDDGLEALDPCGRRKASSRDDFETPRTAGIDARRKRRDHGGKTGCDHGVGDQQGRQFEDLEVTVDTGSTFTTVPRALLQRLGMPVRRSARSRLADGSTVPVDIGWTVVRLEDALLAVDPVGQRLVPVEAERL